jgi:hypothetical protein
MLLVQAGILLLAIRAGLLVVPFSVLRNALAWLATTRTRRGNAGDAGWVIWAVERVGGRFPAIGTCLTEALAAHVLLGRRGQQSDLRIGVRRGANGEFAAHAWLEDDGVVLIGGGCHSSYVPMPVLEGLERRP